MALLKDKNGIIMPGQAKSDIIFKSRKVICMMKGLPAGIDSFERVRKGNYYFVDKSLALKDLLDPAPAAVTLLTRPRRFGKSMLLSMFRNFLDIGQAGTDLFTGLKIHDDKEFCDLYFHQYPVIYLSFKEIISSTPSDEKSARAALIKTVGETAEGFAFLLTSEKLNESDKMAFRRISTRNRDMMEGDEFMIADDSLRGSLKTLSRLLHKHYGVPAVILIDGCDELLGKAFSGGYYHQFINLYMSFLSSALKSNDDLAFAVMTGCLKISEESIITGLNNLTVMDVIRNDMDEYFGFTQQEAEELLTCYGLSDYKEMVKAFYDGYHFGSQLVYNPWSVISFVKDAVSAVRKGKEPIPPSGWMNSSQNSILETLMKQADADVRRDLQALSDGKTIVKKLNDHVTYPHLFDTPEHIWAVLLHTGYLTCTTLSPDGMAHLMIPNEEVHRSFDECINQWAMKTTEEGKNLKQFCDAVETFNPDKIQQAIQILLKDVVSIRDTAAKSVRENYYHGILNCAVSYRQNWLRYSNPETGEGYCDIAIEDPDFSWGIIFELKFAEKGKFENALKEAESQIHTCHYAEMLEEDGVKRKYLYAMAFHGKNCRVRQVNTCGS